MPVWDMDGSFDPEFGRDTRDVERMVEDEREALVHPRPVPFPCPVSRRIRRVRQPAGGLLPVSMFDRVALGDREPLRPRENLSPALVGTVVDYLSRVACGQDPAAAFRVPLAGARLVGRGDEALYWLSRVDGFGEEAVAAACVLCSWDDASRRGPETYRRMPVRAFEPDMDTVWNIRRMVARTLLFLDRYGPVVWEGFTFEGGYTDLVTSGAGDFLTSDTLWDMKCSSYGPNPTQTLQLLVYWRMGVHSVHAVYRDMTRLGLFNPRLDVAYLLDVADIPDDVIHAVEHEVIGYGDDA